MILLKFKLPISKFLKNYDFPFCKWSLLQARTFSDGRQGNMFLCCFGVPLFYFPILSNMFFHLFFLLEKMKGEELNRAIITLTLCSLSWERLIACTIMRTFFILSVNEKFFRDVKLIFRNVLKICILVWTILPAVSLLQ